MIKEIKVNEQCIGCGTCAMLAEEAFEIGADGKSQVKEGALQLSEEKLLMVAQNCPVKAIELYDETGEKVFPK